MRIYLQTRAFARDDDYMFLGREPDERWWEVFGPYVNFERQSLVVRSDGRTWRLAVTALPTGRRDAVETRIRTTLMLDGDVDGPDGPDTALVGRLVDSWLADQADGGQRIADRLDRALPEGDMPELYVKDDDAVWERVAGLVRGVIEDLGEPSDDTPVPPSSPAERLDDSWVGRLADGGDRSILAGAARALLTGTERGLAAYLNLVRTGEYAIRAVRALTNDPETGVVYLLTDLPAGVHLPPKSLPASRGQANIWVLVGLTLMGLGAVAALIWIAGRMGLLPRAS